MVGQAEKTADTAVASNNAAGGREEENGKPWSYRRNLRIRAIRRHNWHEIWGSRGTWRKYRA